MLTNNSITIKIYNMRKFFCAIALVALAALSMVSCSKKASVPAPTKAPSEMNADELVQAWTYYVEEAIEAPDVEDLNKLGDSNRTLGEYNSVLYDIKNGKFELTAEQRKTIEEENDKAIAKYDEMVKKLEADEGHDMDRINAIINFGSAYLFTDAQLEKYKPISERAGAVIRKRMGM